MKLDPSVMRTMNKQDFRVLAAVETGMKGHSLVPLALINSIANLRHGGTNKVLSGLLRDKLLSHDQSCGYDGYRLTNSGYDILALHNLKSRGIIAGIGDKIGTGKESDVYVAITPRNTQVVLKFHRLGRTSFRDVKKKRDYFMVNALSKNKKHGTQYRTLPNSWLFLSRTSAIKEYAFMKSLYDVGYPTPKPLGQNRHIVAMSVVRGLPLYQLHSNRVSAEQAQSIFEQSAVLAGRLAQHGLVHCDLNEFNLIVDLSGVQSKIANSGVEGVKRSDDLDGEDRDWEDDATEHYVRHAGLPDKHKGALSSNATLQKHGIDGTGEVVVEAPPEPQERLPGGDPKPIVTLIDFPQMISTRHPNAKELYERDVECLKIFFSKKLKCHVEGETEDSRLGGIMPSWEELIANSNQDDTEEDGDGSDDVTLVSKAQLRLDEDLKASGYSEEDAARDSELMYYQARQRSNRGLDDVNEEESDEEGSDEDYDNGEEEDAFEADVNPVVEETEQAPELLDMDNFHISQKNSNADDGASFAGGVSISGMSRMSQLSHAEVEHIARERVKKHLEDRKRASGRKGAFKSRNSNKSYSKGKRVMNDFGI
ncbi:serine/threonine-protein kinase, RIO family [Skeletonema marinoi]|uniref:Serine/threonine-protein kinase RIO2 n=1 Tax=Skeletonema marinoi TaxID=267567 RepID=A0AAD9DK78_9STRA|nr:serine/threonine-protein kinase, RIO family [Skeletonema marinoi]